MIVDNKIVIAATNVSGAAENAAATS
jgi:hypothetical protein